MELQRLRQRIAKYEIRTSALNCINQFKLQVSQCLLCSNKDLVHPLICQHCYADLPFFKHGDVEHNLLNWPAVDKLFPRRYFDSLHSLSPYIWPTAHWVKKLKYRNHFEIADLLAFLLNETWQLDKGESAESSAIIAVPIHVNKWKKRGYNQAHLIAHAFAKFSHVTYQTGVLARAIDGDSQVGQSGTARRRSLKNAFVLSSETAQLPHRVILIDDVITTGSTVNAISSLLKSKGVKRITVMTAALTLPN